MPSPCPSTRWTNLAGIGSCHPMHHHYPTTTEEVQQAVELVRSQNGKCRVAGGGMSPNAATFTNEHLIHMERMNRILAIDTAARTITCEAGAVMEEVMRSVDEVGLMVRCVPSYVRTTVGGCIATATHSSGIHSHCLSDYVRGLKIVDGCAQIRTLVAGKDDAELRLAACHLGVMGIVTEVTLEVQPRIQWQLISQPLSIKDATNAALVAEKVKSTEYYRWWWVPHTDGCYESYGRVESTTDTSALPPLPDAVGAQEEALGKRSPAAAHKESRTGGSAAGTGNSSTSLIVRSALKYMASDFVRHQVVEWGLWAACLYPAIQPYVNKAYERVFFSAPQVQRGSALECFTFDCLFKQWANEWAIDASRAVEAFDRLRDMINREGMLLHFPVEFRFTAGDMSDMSPAVGRPTCWIGVVMYRPYGREARDTRRCYDGFCRLMEEMGGRPHWAKYYTWGHREVAAAYGDHWERFLALRRKMDPDDIFVNGWFRNLMSPDRVNSTTFTG
ncbi:L-gulonolactone oxidase, putative [Leishmania tarentolae]|uniref:L-gulonolactone oxidase n=1 Tax=Leishmania tarentolae TaxID=5689 RepID=A0A640KDN2_LEITA|nr:L-gulonolactone oxidase, putative [Leishmania tarentolae]